MQRILYEKKKILVNKQNIKSINSGVCLMLIAFFDSKADEDSESKKRKTCRAGAEIEATYGRCDTDGFQEKQMQNCL